MKNRIISFFAVLLLFAAGGVHASDHPLGPSFDSYVRYFAGIEVLSTEKTLSQSQKAEKYRRLCAITGINGARAKAFVLRYKNDAAGWWKFQTAVLEILQKKG